MSHLDAIVYLIDKGLLKASEVVDDGVKVVDISRRNLNFKVSRADGSGFFLKQASSQGEAATIERECAAYKFLIDALRQAERNRYLVRFYDYDAERNVLVLELVRNAVSLETYQLKTSRSSVRLARQLGRAFGALHNCTRPAGEQRLYVFFPWPFSISLPRLASMRDLTGASLQLIRIVQNSAEFCDLLDHLRGEWSTECLIHGDYKSSNCLVVAGSVRPAAEPRQRLIDWELAGWGDPAWDVGSVLHDYLFHWISSIPLVGNDDSNRFASQARYPLEKLFPAIQGFWIEYCHSLCLIRELSSEFLLRSVKYAAVRLIQSAYEQSQKQSQLSGTAIYALQVSLNILQRPLEAMVHLFGLPFITNLAPDDTI